jgi:hypothetical protein
VRTTRQTMGWGCGNQRKSTTSIGQEGNHRAASEIPSNATLRLYTLCITPSPFFLMISLCSLPVQVCDPYCTCTLQLAGPGPDPWLLISPVS